jgi:hypothetical protein
MKKLILLFISFLMISITGNAQDILDGAYDRKTTYENRKVQSYPYLRQADVMWSRKIWREIRIGLHFSVFVSGLTVVSAIQNILCISCYGNHQERNK